MKMHPADMRTLLRLPQDGNPNRLNLRLCSVNSTFSIYLIELIEQTYLLPAYVRVLRPSLSVRRVTSSNPQQDAAVRGIMSA
jgi:hypothetical protein